MEVIQLRLLGFDVIFVLQAEAADEILGLQSPHFYFDATEPNSAETLGRTRATQPFNYS